jgi:hypothetical protein
MVSPPQVEEFSTMAVSVCIPTYKRHELLEQCLQSAFATGVRPLDIVVSDDAHESALAERLARLVLPPGIELRYVENARGSGQAANVQNAFEHARREAIVLMHDDDFFVPGGVDALWRAWREAGDAADAVFGRQRMVADDGTYLAERTRRWNRKYRRLAPGPVPSNLWSALVQQFPMNGMMIRRSLALAAGVPPEAEVGHHTDLHFAVRYARVATRPFHVIDAEVSAYRLSTTSVARPGDVYKLTGDLNYAALEGIEPCDEWERWGRRHALDGAAGRAILTLVAQGRRGRAWRLFARHALRMRVPPATRAKIVFVMMGTLVGVRWSATVLGRRRLGLPRLPTGS